jgi:O-antigen/teichoic acid export membrane protein
LAASLAFFAPILIEGLFGARYSDAIPLLQVQSIALPFVFMGAVLSKWIIAEGRLGASVVRHWAGAALNVALNLWLLPRYGLVAAAMATGCSYITANYLSLFLIRSTRQPACQMSLAIVWPFRLGIDWTRRRLC